MQMSSGIPRRGTRSRILTHQDVQPQQSALLRSTETSMALSLETTRYQQRQPFLNNTGNNVRQGTSRDEYVAMSLHQPFCTQRGASAEHGASAEVYTHTSATANAYVAMSLQNPAVSGSVSESGSLIATAIGPQEEIPSLHIYEWYHGKISRQKAEVELRNHGIHGSFLVRESLNVPGQFVVSIRLGNSVYHFQIYEEEHGCGFYINTGDELCSTLPALVAKHRKHPIIGSKSGVHIKLLEPLGKSQCNPCVPGDSDYEVMSSVLPDGRYDQPTNPTGPPN
jgi:hypothetical protein